MSRAAWAASSAMARNGLGWSPIIIHKIARTAVVMSIRIGASIAFFEVEVGGFKMIIWIKRRQ